MFETWLNQSAWRHLAPIASGLVRSISEPEFTDLWQPDRPMPSLSIFVDSGPSWTFFFRFEPEYHDGYLYVDKDIRKDWTHIISTLRALRSRSWQWSASIPPTTDSFQYSSVHGCRWLQQKGPLATGAPGLLWIHGGQHLSTSHCSEVLGRCCSLSLLESQTCNQQFSRAGIVKCKKLMEIADAPSTGIAWHCTSCTNTCILQVVRLCSCRLYSCRNAELWDFSSPAETTTAGFQDIPIPTVLQLIPNFTWSLCWFEALALFDRAKTMQLAGAGTYNQALKAEPTLKIPTYPWRGIPRYPTFRTENFECL